MRTSEQIQAEIEQKFGFIPFFFRPAQQNPQVLENLWQQTLCAYINNPLPHLFKEKLCTYLSRYCAIPYCMIYHSCSLHPLELEAWELLELLEASAPIVKNIESQLNALAAQPGSLTVLPDSNSALEESILYCSTFIFLEPAQAERCRNELRRLLGSVNYQHLVAFLCYVKTCHSWIEAYPEVAYKTDQRVQNHIGALLEHEPRLADFFLNCGERVRHERQSREEQLLAEIAKRKRKEAEARLLQSMTQAISESEDFHSALGVTLRKVCEVAGWNFGEAWIPRPDGAALECSPAWYGTNSGLEQFRKLSEGLNFHARVGLPGRVWASKQPEWDQDVSMRSETTYIRAQIAKDCGLRTALGIPLISSEQVLAVLVFYMFESHEEDERLVELISSLTQLGSVVQRKQAEVALRQSEQAATAQVQELAKLNRLKDEFLSTVSHELRTPVTNIKIAIHMLALALNQQQALFLEAPKAEQSQIASYLQILQDECEREISLINDLLDLQRLDARVQPLALEKICLKTWLTGVFQSFQARALNRNQTLQLDLPSVLPPLVSDLSSLERLLAELLNNACKYTPPGEQITLSANFQSGTIQFRVINTGVEIPEPELPRIFDKFYRIPSTNPWKQGGTGLGLALVQKLIEHLGGTIRVESTSGQTCFIVELPVA